MIAIVDYGMGNLRSVQNAFRQVGHESLITSDPRVIREASHLVLPGVGAFSECMQRLGATGLIREIIRGIGQGKFFLGICLGFQLLFTKSEEFGEHAGLNLFPGIVKRFPASGLKVPHIGWNQIEMVGECPVFAGIPQRAFVYFDHSYYVVPEEGALTASWSDYGVRFTSSVWRNHVFACQFHPEKSQMFGLRILQNFGNLK